jgi:hypothetical protein
LRGSKDSSGNSASIPERGINESDIDLISKENTKLSEILENVWNDGRLEKRIKGLRYGIPISTALIGTMAAGLLGGVGGFLSGIGINNVIPEIIGVNQDSIAEGLAKKIMPNHLVNIFDFKRKYNIEKQ